MWKQFLSYVGIALAIVALVGGLSWWKIVLLTIAITLGFVVVEKIIVKVSNSNNKWIDSIIFLFTKNPNTFYLEDKIIHFDIADEKHATYTVKAKVVQQKNVDNVIYHARYRWSQEEDVRHAVKVDGEIWPESMYRIGEDIKWSTVTVLSNGIVHKNDKFDVEYVLENLFIDKLKYHRFLSCKVIEKIKNLQMKISIDPSLTTQNTAEFIVQNKMGIKISSERITMDEHNHTFSKTIYKPKIGRKYIIKLL